MSDNGLRTYEVQLSIGEGVRVVYGDEWTSDSGYLRVWKDDVLVFEAAPNSWTFILDETSKIESEISLRPTVAHA
jgi:hypothetical protein